MPVKVQAKNEALLVNAGDGKGIMAKKKDLCQIPRIKALATQDTSEWLLGHQNYAEPVTLYLGRIELY